VQLAENGAEQADREVQLARQTKRKFARPAYLRN